MLDLKAIFDPNADVPPNAAESQAIDLADATAVWQAALDRVEGNPLFPPDAMAALRSAEVRWDNRAHDGPGPYTAGQEPT